jgi:hypothetical protein
MDRAAFTAVVAGIAGGTIYYLWRVAQDVAAMTGTIRRWSTRWVRQWTIFRVQLTT